MNNQSPINNLKNLAEIFEMPLSETHPELHQLTLDYAEGVVYPYEKVKELLRPSTDGFMDIYFKYMARDLYIKKISFVALTRENIDYLAMLLQNKKVIEVGAGTGYLARQLKEKHINILPIDSQDYYFENIPAHCLAKYCRIKIGNAITYVAKNRHDAVIMSWPPYDSPFALNIAKAMKKGALLVYQGEARGGCTANHDFFDYLESNFILMDVHSMMLNVNHVCFSGIHDQWRIFIKQ